MYRVHNFIRTLAHTFDLPRKTDRERLFWGKVEATILLQYLEKHNTSIFNFESTLQTMNIIKVLVTIGSRPGSLGRSQYEDEDFCALPLHCITIHQNSRLAYEIKLDLVSLKATDPTQAFTVKQVEMKKDILLDLSVTLIPALIARGVLYDDLNKKMISNITEFLGSSSITFSTRSSTTENLFLQGSQGHSGLSKLPITSRGVTDSIGAVARACHLPFEGVYAFCHDVGNAMYHRFGKQAAQLVMNHSMAKGRVLEKHYTTATAAMDMTAIRITTAGQVHEFSVQTRGQQSGLLTLARGLKAAGDAKSSAKPATSSAKTTEATTKSPSTRAEEELAHYKKDPDAYIAKDQRYQKLKSQFERALKDLNSGLPASQRISTTRPVNKWTVARDLNNLALDTSHRAHDEITALRALRETFLLFAKEKKRSTKRDLEKAVRKECLSEGVGTEHLEQAREKLNADEFGTTRVIDTLQPLVARNPELSEVLSKTRKDMASLFTTEEEETVRDVSKDLLMTEEDTQEETAQGASNEKSYDSRR
ncbi:unnamed protein product [Sympodiomycopsis kandeliae]